MHLVSPGCSCDLPGERGPAWFPSQNCWPLWPGPEKGNLIVTLKTWSFIGQSGEPPPPKKIFFQIFGLRVSKMPHWSHYLPSSRYHGKRKLCPPSTVAKEQMVRARCLLQKKKKKKRTEKKRTGTWSLWRNSVELLSLWLALLLQQSAASDTHLQVHYSRVQRPFSLCIRPPLHRVAIAAVWSRTRPVDLTCGSDSHKMEKFYLELKNQQNYFWKTHLVETNYAGSWPAGGAKQVALQGCKKRNLFFYTLQMMCCKKKKKKKNTGVAFLFGNAPVSFTFVRNKDVSGVNKADKCRI